MGASGSTFATETGYATLSEADMGRVRVRVRARVRVRIRVERHLAVHGGQLEAGVHAPPPAARLEGESPNRGCGALGHRRQLVKVSGEHLLAVSGTARIAGDIVSELEEGTIRTCPVDGGRVTRGRRCVLMQCLLSNSDGSGLSGCL